MSDPLVHDTGATNFTCAIIGINGRSSCTCSGVCVSFVSPRFGRVYEDLEMLVMKHLQVSTVYKLKKTALPKRSLFHNRRQADSFGSHFTALFPASVFVC
ncbi:hypothetical protein GDO86_007337 [Hymenochirus boettgeri]|uniref:Uncharacterized protein n=1 Tax=Hymenochirus boettgeri TaxID=247094 RepID=A0A8T2J0I3_9PIPI|nr:hypothetical protein GDO86_007337 [Hymenochirus boettgeri]